GATEISSSTRKVGKPTQPPASQAQRSAMREIAKGSMPARGCSKGPARGCSKGAGLAEGISYWNQQIFYVNWGCFISPQGSHALCNGKIVARFGGQAGGDMRMYRFALAALVCAAVLAPSALAAQTYPSKPIHFILPYVPGGIIDTSGRKPALPLADTV